MPRVDFYLLRQYTANGKLLAICRLSQKVYGLGHSALIVTADAATAGVLDELLWTFDQGSFVPHGIVDEPMNAEAHAVAISHRTPSKHRHNVLISMLDEVPTYFDRYPRIAEIVDKTPADRARARDRYRVYRQHKCELETHDI